MNHKHTQNEFCTNFKNLNILLERIDATFMNPNEWVDANPYLAFSQGH